MPVADVDFVFDNGGTITGFGQDVASDVLVLVGRIFVRVADPKKVTVGEGMEDAAFGESMMDGGGNVFVDGTELICSVNDGLHGIDVAIERQKESSFLVPAERTAERTFVILAGLVGLLDGEGVGSVKDGVAIKKIYGAMEIGCAGLGGNFQASAARIGEKNGVGILVDADFLNGGGSNAGSVGFDAVDDQRDAVGGGGVVGEEARERGYVVLAKDRDAIKGVAFEGVGAFGFLKLRC